MAMIRLDRKRTYGDGTANEIKSIKPLQKMGTGSYAAEVPCTDRLLSTTKRPQLKSQIGCLINRTLVRAIRPRPQYSHSPEAFVSSPQLTSLFTVVIVSNLCIFQATKCNNLP